MALSAVAGTGPARAEGTLGAVGATGGTTGGRTGGESGSFGPSSSTAGTPKKHAKAIYSVFICETRFAGPGSTYKLYM